MLKFGVAGYPISFFDDPRGKDRLRIYEWLNILNIDAFEVQMTYGPRMSTENCKSHKEKAESYGIALSIHAAYYIVLTSKEKLKIDRSKDTLLRTYERADLMAANKIVLHPGPLYGEKEYEVLMRFCDNLNDFMNDLGPSKVGLYLETAGKCGQLGSVDDILFSVANIPNTYPCFDFGHIHARERGSLYNGEKIDILFEKIKSSYGYDNKIHFHYTPIEYGKKGEIQHKALTDKNNNRYSDTLSLFEEDTEINLDLYYPRFERIILNMAIYGVSGTIISETHNSQEVGAMEMKKYYNKIK